MSFEEEVGALPPVGFWDPLGLSKDADAEKFNAYRTAELKHGRVAMLAVTGYIVAENYRFPGAIDLDGTTFQSIPNGLAAFGAVPAFGWFQIAASVGFWEIFGWKQASEDVGDFGFLDASTAKKFDGNPAARFEQRTKEIQNGRLAMLAIAGTMFFLFPFVF